MAAPSDQLLQDILDRAARDPAFREHLLRDPAAAIYEGFGVQLPGSYRIRFVEKPSDVHALVVLPDVLAQEELGDDDLDAVAGGDGATDLW